MFKTLSKDASSNTVVIQGAISNDSNADISRLLLQNYDDDTATTYDMAAICARDAFGDSERDGTGDLILQTASNGVLRDSVRVDHSGNLHVMGKLYDMSMRSDVQVYHESQRLPRCKIWIGTVSDSNFRPVDEDGNDLFSTILFSVVQPASDQMQGLAIGL